MKAFKAILGGVVVIVFAVAAGFFVWFAGSIYIRHYEARKWIEVPAVVLDRELRTTRSGTNVSRSPANFSSRLIASYAYSFNGKEYAGNRVDFSIGSDNFSHNRRRDQIERLRSGRVTVFVNPADPQESVFDRRLPGGQISFAIVFLLFPCGLGTAWFFGVLLWCFKKAGVAGFDRFLFPFLGIFHGSFALYPALFAPGDFGFGGWVILSLFLALFAVSLWAVWRRIMDPPGQIPVI